MPLSPESDKYISTDDEGPFTLERYRARLKRKSAANHSNRPIDRGSPVKEAFPIRPVPYLSAQMIHLPPPPIKQIFIKKPMMVGGRGLTALAEIASKAETTREEIIKETQSSSSAKMAKCLTSGENRRFIDALYELEGVIASTAEEVDTNEVIFQNIEPQRIRASWKMAGRALRDLALALSRMTKEHSTEKNVRICRKYVVRVLTRIAVHHSRLTQGMDREIHRVWVGPVPYGDDMGVGLLFKARVADWLNLKPRTFDKLFCKGPDKIVRRGAKEDAVI